MSTDDHAHRTHTEDEMSPLERVLDVLDLDRVDDDTFTGSSLPQLHGRVYGGQVLAQAVIAAMRTTPPDRMIHSLHGYFLRPGNLEEPITFAVERLRDGGSFSARRTHAIQFGKPILSMIASFQEDQPGLDHQDVMPNVTPPEELRSSVSIFGALEHPIAKFFYRNGAFDMRHVQQPLFTGPARQKQAVQAMWIRARAPLPADRGIQRAMLAFACDQVMLEPVMRAHGLSWVAPNSSIASLDHAMWWHRDVNLNDWLLFAQEAPSSQGGRGLGTAKVFTRDGELVATIAQEGMIRVKQELL